MPRKAASGGTAGALPLVQASCRAHLRSSPAGWSCRSPRGPARPPPRRRERRRSRRRARTCPECVRGMGASDRQSRAGHASKARQGHSNVRRPHWARQHCMAALRRPLLTTGRPGHWGARAARRQSPLQKRALGRTRRWPPRPTHRRRARWWRCPASCGWAPCRPYYRHWCHWPRLHQSVRQARVREAGGQERRQAGRGGARRASLRLQAARCAQSLSSSQASQLARPPRLACVLGVMSRGLAAGQVREVQRGQRVGGGVQQAVQRGLGL